MATFWFVSAPLFGHLDWGGFLRTAQALQAAGHQVLWVSEAPIGPHVEGQGLPFAAVDETGWRWPPPPAPDFSTMPPPLVMQARYQRALDTWLSEDLVEQGTSALLGLAERVGPPDVIASDPFLTASALAAEKLGVKLAVCGWPAHEGLRQENLFSIQQELAAESRQRIQRLAQSFGLTGENFSSGPTPAMQSPHLHISYFSRYWYQAESDFLPQTEFVGGFPAEPDSPPPEWMEQLPSDKRLVLITLGSVFTGDFDFFAGAAQAAYRGGAHPIVVIGYTRLASTDKEKLIQALPPRTFLLNWVPFDHVLPRLSAIVHHGGMGTTHAAVVHAVPQVIVPRAADQRGQAVRASQAKVGLNLTAQDVQRGQLEPAIRAISTDEKVKDNCRKLQAQFAKLGGPPRAAELLLDLAQK